MSGKIEVDTMTFVRFWLVILGFVLMALFIWKAATGLLIVGISLFLAIAISPLVGKVASITAGRAQKSAIAAAYVIVMVVIVGVLAVIVPTVVSETTKFATNLPSTVESASSSLAWVNDVGNRFGITDLRGQLMYGINDISAQLAHDLGSNILNSVGAIGSFFAGSVLVLVLTFLMLMQGPAIMRDFWRNFERNKRTPIIQKVLERMAGVIAKYVSGVLLVALICGIATTLVVFILSLIFGFSSGLALPFGLIAGVMSLIPIFGAFIGGTLVALLLAINSLWAGVVFAIYYIIYQQVEGNVILPKVQSKGMRLPALLVLGAVTIGMYMFGLIGAIVAIPIAGCLKVIAEEYGTKK
jgi:predicted PurR-regulated permease PerM